MMFSQSILDDTCTIYEPEHSAGDLTGGLPAFTAQTAAVPCRCVPDYLVQGDNPMGGFPTGAVKILLNAGVTIYAGCRLVLTSTSQEYLVSQAASTPTHTEVLATKKP